MYFSDFFIVNIYPTVSNVLVYNDFVGYMLRSFMLYICVLLMLIYAAILCVCFTCTLSENDKIKLFNQSDMTCNRLYVPFGSVF